MDELSRVDPALLALGSTIEARAKGLKRKRRRREMTRLAKVAKGYLRAAKTGKLMLSQEQVAAFRWLGALAKRIISDTTLR